MKRVARQKTAVSTAKPVSIGKRLKRSGSLYLLMLPSLVIMFLFTYIPMYGVTIAFKDFTPSQGIMGSSWAGLKYFRQYFNSYQFWITIKNTLVISLYSIVVTFPLPIALALMCNQMARKGFKKFFQVSTYLPHFISTVVMCGMIILFLSPSQGIIGKASELCGNYPSEPDGPALRFFQYLCMDRSLAACGLGQYPLHSGPVGSGSFPL